MQIFTSPNSQIEFEIRGKGEPVLLIHGSIWADCLFPLISDVALTRQYMVISYHRHGFAGSGHDTNAYPMEAQVEDGQHLLKHLGISSAHVLGYSYGGAIAIQWALNAPQEIRSLTLIEPALMNFVPSGHLFWDDMREFETMFKQSKHREIIDTYFNHVLGENYAALLKERLPPNAFQIAILDLATFFLIELPALADWKFGGVTALSLDIPVFAVLSDSPAEYALEAHARIKEWFPNTDEIIIPNTNHALPIQNPNAIVKGLLTFLKKLEISAQLN